MKEQPILFSGPMVRAILEGRKTVTRRIMKPQPVEVTGSGRRVYRDADFKKSWEWISGTGEGVGYSDCPYGKPGDRLWVRETFYAYGAWRRRYSEKKRRNEWYFDDLTIEYGEDYRYSENAPDYMNGRLLGVPNWHKRPSIHMPRSASRILLEITDIRVERLQDISEADAKAEGVENQLWYDKHADKYLQYFWNYAGAGYQSFPTARQSFTSLWESINGPESWDENPWVWVITFKRINQ